MKGKDSRPFIMSSRFLEGWKNINLSSTLGRDAAEASNWLQKEEEQLVHGWLLVPHEQRVGHLLETLTSVASGDLVMVPFLPSYGLGESLEGPQKRGGRGESYGRRIRGFPNLLVGLQRQSHPVENILEGKAEVLRKQEIYEGENPYESVPSENVRRFDKIEEVKGEGERVQVDSDSMDVDYFEQSEENKAKNTLDLVAESALDILTKGNEEILLDEAKSILKAILSTLEFAGEEGLTSDDTLSLLHERGMTCSLHLPKFVLSSSEQCYSLIFQRWIPSLCISVNLVCNFLWHFLLLWRFVFRTIKRCCYRGYSPVNLSLFNR